MAALVAAWQCQSMVDGSQTGPVGFDARFPVGDGNDSAGGEMGNCFSWVQGRQAAALCAANSRPVSPYNACMYDDRWSVVRAQGLLLVGLLYDVTLLE